MKTFLLKNPIKLLAFGAVAVALGLTGTATGQTHQERTYADFQGTTEYGVNLGLAALTGTVTNPANAVSASIRDSSTLAYTISALGVLGAGQFLQFTTDGTTPRTIAAGTPIYVKVSLPKSLIGLLDNLQIGTFTNLHAVAGNLTRKDGYDATKTPVFTSANLLNAINGSGTVEFKVVSTEDANGVYVNLSSVLGTVSTADVFSAYVLDDAAGDAGCPKPIDWLSGTEDVVGIDLASATASVDNPSFAIDADLNTPTTISTGAEVASVAYYTALLNTPGRAGDSVQVIMNNPDPGLINLALLSGFTIQAYNGDTEVGDPVAGNSSLLTLQLLPGSTSKNVIKVPIQGANAGNFDRIKLTFGGVADVSSILGNGTTDIYDISLKVPAPSLNTDVASDQYAYSGNTVDLSSLVTANAAGDPIIWIDSATGTPLSSATVTASATTHYFAVSERDGCTEASDTAKFTLHVASTTSPDLTSGNVGEAYSQQITAEIDGDNDLPNTPTYTFTYESSTFTPAEGAAAINNNSAVISSLNRYAMLSQPYVYGSGPLSQLSANAFAATDLTHGLSFDDATGTVSGTPDAEGVYSLVLNVHDDANGLDAGQITKSITISQALPVTLSSWDVNLDGNKNAVLTWETQSEQNSVRFDILRSRDGNNFTKIGSKEAAGNSTTPRSYSFTDNNPGAKSYYQLSIVNNGAPTKTSNVISITGGHVASFSISPNPASNQINITGINNDDIANISIYDATGRLIKSATNSNIKVSALSSGIYFVTVVQKDGTKLNGKFLKK